MSFKVTVDLRDFDPQKILNSRGLGGDHAANTFLANEVKRLSEPYVPMQQGTLSHGQVQGGAPATIKYNTPYAHYQWTGLAMGGRAPKHYTGGALSYHGGPMRGKEWTQRMMADRGPEVVKSFANYVGGKPG